MVSKTEALDVIGVDAFETYLAQLPPALETASKRLCLFFHRPAGERSDGWLGHFSHLAKSYPSAQLSPLGVVPAPSIDAAQLAHLQILVHSVLEDRMMDDQVPFSRADWMFTKQLFVDALAALVRISDERSGSRNWLTYCLTSYASAQCHSYESESSPENGPLKPIALRSIVCGRGRLGLLATVTVAARFVHDDRLLWKIRNAYDALMMGMQWADDLRDWEEDLAVGDVNLLLHALRLRGLDAYNHPDNNVRVANVGHALEAHGILDLAVTSATRWFAVAAERQRCIGCNAMAQLIERKVAPLADWRHDQAAKIARQLEDAATAIGMLNKG